MRRRIVWNEGDSSPIYGRLVTTSGGASPLGTGTLKIVTGFPVSAAMVSFAETYSSGSAAGIQTFVVPEVLTAQSTTLSNILPANLFILDVQVLVTAIDPAVASLVAGDQQDPQKYVFGMLATLGNQQGMLGTQAPFMTSSAQDVIITCNAAPTALGVSVIVAYMSDASLTPSEGSSGDPKVYVEAVEEDGFVVGYEGVPAVLDINYYVM